MKSLDKRLVALEARCPAHSFELVVVACDDPARLYEGTIVGRYPVISGEPFDYVQAITPLCAEVNDEEH